MDFDQGPMSKHLALQAQQYRVPNFQRPYSWGSDEWRTLWVDILRQYREVSKGWKSKPADADVAVKTEHLEHTPTHYLGALVTANPVTVTPPRSSLIDGQQRILTSWILLLACRDFALKRLGTSAKNVPAADAVRKRFASYLTNVGHRGTDAWRILPQAMDEPAFRHLMLDTRKPAPVKIESTPLGPADSAGLLQAYNFFLKEMSRRKLPARVPFEMLSFGDLFELDPDILEYTVMNRLYAIKLIAGGTDDPNMIFESLNTKGRDLQQVDLIKNFLYLRLRENADEVYASYWRPMENVLRPGQLERFAWASLVSRGENVLQKRTYEAVQRRLRSANAEQTKAYVIDLHAEAGWFKRLLVPKEEERAVVQTAITDVVAAGGLTALPLLLYCYRRLQDGATTEDFRLALYAVESFLVRRMIAGDLTNNLNSMFGSMCSRLHSDARFAPTDSLEQDIQRVLASRPEDWPRDDRVTAGIRSADFYGAQSMKQRIHILKRIDQRAKKSQVKLEYAESIKSIEHIAPQNEKADWWTANLSPGEWEQLQERAHSLGNLTLLPPSVNSSLGDKGWPTKHLAYAKCDYPMTAQLAVDFDLAGGWTLKRLNKRADDLAKLVIAIWPRVVIPPHDVDESADADAAGADDDDDFSEEGDDDAVYESSLLESGDAELELELT